jgi:hypothetical protein
VGKQLVKVSEMQAWHRFVFKFGSLTQQLCRIWEIRHSDKIIMYALLSFSAKYFASGISHAEQIVSEWDAVVGRKSMEATPSTSQRSSNATLAASLVMSWKAPDS